MYGVASGLPLERSALPPLRRARLRRSRGDSKVASHTHLKGSRRRWSVLLGVFVLFALGATAPALGMNNESGSSTPWIASDLPDYAPGETVTLTGGNWQPGESVHINVNDDKGQTWSRNVDVTASAQGSFTDQFQLPTTFIALYTVTATGATSGTATTTFTDANLKVKGSFVGSTTDSYTLTYTRYSLTSCGGTARSGDPQSDTITTADKTIPPASQNSVQLSAAATSAAGRSFVNWTDPDGTVVSATATWCADFPASGTDKTYSANYAALVVNTAPTANAVSVSTNEDTPVAITLSGSDAQQCELTFSIVSGPTSGSLGSITNNSCTPGSPNTDT